MSFSFSKTLLIVITSLIINACGTKMKNTVSPSPPPINNVSAGHLVGGSVIAASAHYKATVQSNFVSTNGATSNSYQNRSIMPYLAP